MLYREVPKNGDKLSVLGYGCMRFPGKRQSINEKLAEKQILHALDQGLIILIRPIPTIIEKANPFWAKCFLKTDIGKR